MIWFALLCFASGMLRRLQRAFWPFPWEGELSRDGGGFAQACMAALGEGEAMNASQQVNFLWSLIDSKELLACFGTAYDSDGV